MRNQKTLEDMHTHTTAYIKWGHIDGPMLRCSDGNIHFLTLFERLMFSVGVYNITTLDKMYNNEPCQS